MKRRREGSSREGVDTLEEGEEPPTAPPRSRPRVDSPGVKFAAGVDRVAVAERVNAHRGGVTAAPQQMAQERRSREPPPLPPAADLNRLAAADLNCMHALTALQGAEARAAVAAAVADCLLHSWRAYTAAHPVEADASYNFQVER